MSIPAVVQADSPSAAPAAWPSRRALVAWWLAALVFLLAFIGNPPVQRTQEARVLETAREMLGQPWRAWLIPQLNGSLRLRKPPLTYWLAAGAFEVGDVNETAGRVPTALLGWLTLAVTFLAAERLFGRRAGFFAAAGLLSSYLFFRHARLAETDAPATLFVTCAVYAILRAADARPVPLNEDGRAGGTTSTLWLHAAAAASALAFLAKGGPGLFPILFLLGYAAVTGRWDLPRRFVTGGAIVTCLVIGASWYAYAAAVSGPKQFFEEMRELGTGEDHAAPFYMYFPQILVATAPWTGMVVVGLVEAVRRCRRRFRDPRARVMLVWVAAILLPLFFAGNKQFHYLMPLMPPLLILAGWAADAACGGDAVGDAERPEFVSLARGVIRVTVILSFVAVLALPWAARLILGTGKGRPADLVLGTSLLVLLAGVGLCRKARGRANGVAAYAAGCAAALAVLVGVWFPSLKPHGTRTVAAEIRQAFPQGPYCFYGTNFSLPLCFHLRTEIPLADDARELLAMVRDRGVRVVIAQTKSGRDAPRPVDAADGSVRFVPAARVQGEGQVFELYRVEGAGQ